MRILFSELRWNRSLFSELVWNISEFSKGFLAFRAHFISELQWNSHLYRIVILPLGFAESARPCFRFLPARLCFPSSVNIKGVLEGLI
jgi:hypothetical protein